MVDYGEQAVKYFDEGYNCAESTFLALCDAMGKDGKSILTLVTGFGGGMGRSDSVCGVVSGAIAAIGLKVNRKAPQDGPGKERVYELVNRFVKEFRQELGAIDCTSINGFNFATEEGYAQFRAQDRHTTHCAPAVKKAVELAMAIW
ncbi:MAG: C-GCAxxG-C-C family protein [Limnochordia bacterium]|jgi:C_GCAxxG_C_C family probable redox protein